MSVSVDGFIADRDGAFGWSVPSDEQFRFHLEQVRGLGSCLLGRRLYETMLVWETDPSLRDNEDTDAFADVWSALPKVVFSRTLDRVQGNARLAEAPLAEEVAAALAATDKDVEIGGAGPPARVAGPRPARPARRGCAPDRRSRWRRRPRSGRRWSSSAPAPARASAAPRCRRRPAPCSVARPDLVEAIAQDLGERFRC